MSEEDTEKREQERLLRTMNKVGFRGRSASNAPGAAAAARPVSWNVNITGRAAGGSLKKNEQAEALRALQEQIKQEEKNAVAAGTTVEVKASSEPSPRPEASLEDQAELNAISAFNEQRELERISKWTKTRGALSSKSEATYGAKESSHERPIPAVLMRQFAIEDALKEENNKEESSPALRESQESNQEIVKLTASITITAKALRQSNGEVLARGCHSVVLGAKKLAGLASDDEYLLSWARALEGTSNMLRGRLDGGGDGHEYFNEISNQLGQLYLSAVSLS